MRTQNNVIKKQLCTAGLVLSLLAGCSHQPPGSLLFEEGYTAGCSDGTFDAGGPSDQVEYMRDDTLYRTKPDYKNGWQQGYAKCYRDATEYPEMDNRG